MHAATRPADPPGRARYDPRSDDPVLLVRFDFPMRSCRRSLARGRGRRRSVDALRRELAGECSSRSDIGRRVSSGSTSSRCRRPVDGPGDVIHLVRTTPPRQTLESGGSGSTPMVHELHWSTSTSARVEGRPPPRRASSFSSSSTDPDRSHQHHELKFVIFHDLQRDQYIGSMRVSAQQLVSSVHVVRTLVASVDGSLGVPTSLSTCRRRCPHSPRSAPSLGVENRLVAPSATSRQRG